MGSRMRKSVAAIQMERASQSAEQFAAAMREQERRRALHSPGLVEALMPAAQPEEEGEDRQAIFRPVGTVQHRLEERDYLSPVGASVLGRMIKDYWRSAGFDDVEIEISPFRHEIGRAP